MKQGYRRFRYTSPPCRRDEYRLRSMLVNPERTTSEKLTKVFIYRVSDTEEHCG